jgi:hypothetical protein
MRALTPKAWALAALGALVLGAAGWIVVDWLWTTDEERVLAVIETGRRATEERNAETIESLFVPGFKKNGIPAAELINAAFLALDRYELRSIVVREARAERRGPGYEAEVVARLGPTSARPVAEVTARMRLRRTGGDWKISSFDLMDPATGEPITPTR